MHEAVLGRADQMAVVVMAAAVADYAPEGRADQKVAKQGDTITLTLKKNPDILADLGQRRLASGQGPVLVGFAAETENVAANAKVKLASKGCDWILANDVSPQSGVMGGDRNTITLVSRSGVEAWPPQGKDEVAVMLVTRIAEAIAK